MRLRSTTSQEYQQHAPGDFAPDREVLFDRGALIALAERLSRYGHEIDFVTPGGEGTVETTPVKREADIVNATIARHARHHGLTVRHLRYALGINEAHRFNALEAGVDRPGDQLYFCSVLNGTASFCKPSRGDTSTISICVIPGFRMAYPFAVVPADSIRPRI